MMTATWKTSRWRLRPTVMIISALLWSMLWASIAPHILISGAILGWVIGVVFPLPPMHWKGRFSLVWAAYLVIRLFWDLTVSSFRLIKYAFERKVDLHAGIVRVDLLSDDDLYQVGVASMISLVPGTVVVELVRHPRRLYLHCIGLEGEDPEDAIQEMTTQVEARLLRAFGSKEEWQRFQEERTTPSVMPPTDWMAEEADAEGEPQ